jgi:arylsulfatase A-like enzyme
LRAVDDLIGSVVTELQLNQRYDNTTLVFTSDNGFVFGEHLGQGKRLVYEPSIRVPLYISLPGQTTPQTQNNLVLNNDLAPTIAQWGQATPTITVDGRSLVPLFNSPTSPPWRNQFLVANYASAYVISPFAAIRTADAVYVEHTIENPPGSFYVLPGASLGKGGQEYYDLNSDPDQLTSLHAQVPPPPLLPALQSLLSQFKACQGVVCQALEDLTLIPTGANLFKLSDPATSQPQLMKLQQSESSGNSESSGQGKEKRNTETDNDSLHQ